ncbi:glycosyltransferase [Pseudomonas sp. NPDC047961]
MQSLGVDSHSLVISQNYLLYPVDYALHHPGQSFLLREIKRIMAILFMIPRFDVIHYNAGTTIATAFGFSPLSSRRPGRYLRYLYSLYLRFLQCIEIGYVRLLRKKVFISYFGDDARQSDFCLQNFSISIAAHSDDGYYCEASDKFKRRSIRSLSRMAHGIYAINPDLMHLLPARAQFVPYHHVFPSDWAPAYTQNEGRPLRFLHAPTNRSVKGTQLVLDAFNALEAQGFEFELILVEGKSHDEARRIYESADVLVDQLFAGWYGGLGVELMALGKPVMAYIREPDLVFIPAEMRSELPVLHLTPISIEDDLRGVIQMPRDELVALGKRSRAFVERWHDPKRIAQDILSDYKQALKPQKTGSY